MVWLLVKPLRKHISYANVVATFALVFAMSGGALAAKHYLLSSASQINPKLLKKLRGRPGPRGPAGARGPVGLTGATGGQGAKGVEGAPGQSAVAPLASGQTESGTYASPFGPPAEAKLLDDAVSFPVPLAPNVFGEGINYKKVFYFKPGEVSGECPAVGHAAKGVLCVYSATRSGTLTAPRVVNYERYEGGEGDGAGRYGFVLEWLSESSGFDAGTWSVTAE